MKTRIVLISLLLLLLFSLPAEAEVSYAGKSWPENADYIDLGDTVVTDFGEFTAFLDQLPGLRQVDMWKNRMTAEQCDMLASRYPGIRWGWTMVIRGGRHEHLVRTDYTAWSTLHNNKSARHTSEDFAVLKYCWNLLALDIGHNQVTTLDFLYDLPELRVLILGCNQVTDITPLASLKHLEYAELFDNKIRDVSPLRDLPHLLDLNLCFNRISDLKPVENLKTLQRLWIYSLQKVNVAPEGEWIDSLRAALPNTHIDTTHYSTNGGWRYLGEDRLHPHYEAIIAMFGRDHLHPKTEYVPFEESQPLPGEERPETTPIPTEAEVPLPEPRTPQDFAGSGLLLPVDFSAGTPPRASGYTGETAYADDTIRVTVGSGNVRSCDYWYADIEVKDASQIRTMAASMDGSFEGNGQMDPLRLAERSGAVVAINGDCWNSTEKAGLGFIIRQGILYQNNLEPAAKWDGRMMDVLLIDESGEFTCLRKPVAGSIPGRINGHRILNSFSFGPILVEDGKAVEDFRYADRWVDMARNKRRQRICICQVDRLKYKVVCCAGPFRKNTGMTLREFADLVASLGVRCAYNLDGGDSTLLYFNGQRVNDFGSKSQRKLMDIIYFASAE